MWVRTTDNRILREKYLRWSIALIERYLKIRCLVNMPSGLFKTANISFQLCHPTHGFIVTDTICQTFEKNWYTQNCSTAIFYMVSSDHHSQFSKVPFISSRILQSFSAIPQLLIQTQDFFRRLPAFLCITQRFSQLGILLRSRHCSKNRHSLACPWATWTKLLMAVVSFHRL